MKRFTIVLILLIYSKCVFSAFQFKIIGKTHPELNHKVIYLTIQNNYTSDKFIVKDSTVVKDGNFVFAGTINAISEYGVLSMGGSNFHYLIVDSGTNFLKILPVSKKSLTYRNKLSNTHIENSLSNDLSEKIDSLINVFYVRYSSPSPTNPNVLNLSRDMLLKLDREKLSYIGNYTSTYSALIQLYRVSNKYTVYADELLKTFNNFDLKIRENFLGQDLAQSLAIRKSVEVGQCIREFYSTTSKGDSFSNSILVGKIYLLVFGATWCRPCKESYPILKNLYYKYKKSGFEVIDINLDDNLSAWKEQILHYKLPWINVSQLKKWNETDLVQVFDVHYVPYYILVNKDGKVIYNSIQDEKKGIEYIDRLISNNL